MVPECAYGGADCAVRKLRPLRPVLSPNSQQALAAQGACHRLIGTKTSDDTDFERNLQWQHIPMNASSL